MKKVLLSVLTIGFISTGVSAQDVTIPDANFKAYLVGNTAINTNMDTEIQVSEASVFTGSINCPNQSISDLTGVEAFTALTSLKCGLNQLSSLNVSQNTALVQLECYSNQLTNLDVSQNAALIELTCYENQLTSLNTISNTALTKLICNNTSLTSLDVSQNASLNYLRCFNNLVLTDLNVANGNNTNFSQFNATNTPNLTCIEVDDAAWSTTNWTNIDAVSSFSEDCSGCVVTIPDVSFKSQLVGNTAINTNADAEIQCSEAIAFTGTINCAGFGITDLTGIEAFTSLTGLDCWGNPLLTLDVSQNTSLVYLNCDNCSLTALNVTSNPLLTHLRCGQNQFTSLDVTQNTTLDTLHCGQGFINTLDVSQNTALTFLNCSGNDLSSLDISFNTSLIEFYAQDNVLTNLDASSNTSLLVFWCDNNALTELNIANGNNTNISNVNYFKTAGNPNLVCIEVDDAAWSTTNWTNIDAISSFSTDCAGIAGVNELGSNRMNVYPNPSVSVITIETEEEIESVTVYDLFGSLVQQESKASFSIEALSSGVYFANVRTNTGISRIRFVKK